MPSHHHALHATYEHYRATRIKDSSGKIKTKAKPKQNENTAGTRTNKTQAVQRDKKKKGRCGEGTGLLHALKGTRRAETFCKRESRTLINAYHHPPTAIPPSHKIPGEGFVIIPFCCSARAQPIDRTHCCWRARASGALGQVPTVKSYLQS